MEQKNAETIKHLSSLIKDIKIAMITTVDKDGRLHSRPMATQETTFDGQLYFFIRTGTATETEVVTDQHVNVSYSEPSRQVYVSLTGDAVVVRDMEKMEELWRPYYKTWFPEGLEDPGLALLWINVEKAEYWDTASNIVSQVFGLAKSVLTGKKYTATDHEEITLQ